MTSGGNNFNYFPENQLTKFSAVLQFKHSEKMEVLFCGSAVLFCRAVSSLHIRKSTPLKWKWKCGMPKKDSVVPRPLQLPYFCPQRISVKTVIGLIRLFSLETKR